MLKWLSKIILKVWGFSIEGNNPASIPKKIYILAPHSSNMDFVLGLLVKISMGIKTNFMAKHTLFRFPIKWFVEKLGFSPVDRSKKNGLISQIIDLYNNSERLAIGVAPEGTRKQVSNLKSGFYHIALGAQVPIIMVTFDWGNKRVHFSDPYYVSEDKEKEMTYIENHFAGVVGYNKKQSFRVPLS